MFASVKKSNKVPLGTLQCSIKSLQAIKGISLMGRLELEDLSYGDRQQDSASNPAHDRKAIWKRELCIPLGFTESWSTAYSWFETTRHPWQP